MDFESLMNEPLEENEIDNILEWFEDVYGKKCYQYISLYKLVNRIKELEGRKVEN